MFGINLKIIQDFFALLKADRKEIYQIYFFAVFSGFINLSLPLGIQAIINFLQFGQISVSWIVLLVFVLAGIAFSGVLLIFQISLIENIQRKIFARASFDFTYRITRLKQDKLNDIYAPELMNRFFDVLNLQKGLPKILLDLTASVLQIAFGLLLLAFYHPFFIFFAVLQVIILVGLIAFTFNPGLNSSIQESKYKYKVAYWLEELARSVKTFKLAGITSLPEEKTDILVSKYLDYRAKHFSVLKIIYYSLIGFKLVVALGLLLLGGLLVIQQQMNIGQFVAAEIIILLIIGSVEKLLSSSEVIFQVLTSTDKITHITDLPLESNAGHNFEDICSGKGMEVELNNLGFQNKEGENLLKNISLKIPSGSRICVCGYEGSGKSLLIKLLAGLFDSYEGSITYNHVPLSNIDKQSLRAKIGDVLPQEDIFEGTIYENITLGRPGLTITEVRWATEKAGVSHIIEHFHKGYDTHMEAGGGTLAESTKRKILLARSIVDKPKLLLLEVQHLNYNEKQIITDLILDKSFECTMVIVSNARKIARECDKVIILKEGELVHKGTFVDILDDKTYFDVFDK